ncbi:lmo0954 family membrane protein [Metabacillus arenae]|uniref:Flagellar basal body rod protein n=1 Tax=Metabacillus arenae TaxID=2771434 RepID=A0A926NKM0_9BACI|nr:flagellar basal body rod protein [Metabacillus arenae]MBD1379566.1 flagellar basal body rod protein [Metabacillus arenae]
MKKIGLLIAGVIAALILLGSIGPLIGMIISLAVGYFAFKEFVKTDSKFAKVVWVIIGLIAVTITASNFPAIIAVAAAYVLYLIYKNWNGKKEVAVESDDPFTNFEKQWAEIKKG